MRRGERGARVSLQVAGCVCAVLTLFPAALAQAQRKTVLAHLTHLSSHAMSGRLMLVNRMDADTVLHGHVFAEHLAHAACRALFALEVHHREGRA